MLSPQLSPNPFAEAILSFIDEMKDNEDRKSMFYKQVVRVACRLYLADEKDSDQSLVSALDLSNYITDLESQHRKKSGIRKAFASAQPLVEGLMQYTAAVDVMIQADPTVSALIYGGAKLVLQLADGYTKYFGQITQMMADIGVQLQYFHIYTREFANEKYMSGILCNSYRDILLFWRDASKILNQRGKRFLAAGLLIPFNERYAKFKQKLDKNAQNVRHMAQALHIQNQGAFNAYQTLQVQDLAVALKRAESPRCPGSRGESPRPPGYPETDSAKIEEIKRWIAGGRVSRIDPQPDLERHVSSRHIGTSEWIFDDPVFTNWQSSSENSALWVNAAPGSGKSVLCASVIAKLTQAGKSNQKNVIYFFCRFDEPDKCKAISALKSLAIQALKLVRYLPEELFELYQEECSADDCFINNPAIAERALTCILNHIPYVSVIIDGLDECHELALLDSLARLIKQKGSGITKWLFSSRNDALIRKKLESMNADILTVSNKVVQGDIRRFLEDNADLLCGTCDQLDRITALSEGNFLMIRLTIDPFRNEELTCPEEFEEALENFQPELGRCWFRSLQRLAQRSEQIQKLAQMIFTAVILAAQPMTFQELQDLLSIRIGEEPSARRQRRRSVILSACSPFVEVDYEGDFVNPTIRLVHKSIGDFLTQDPASIDFVTTNCHKFFVRFNQGHAEIGRRCLAYVSYARYSNGIDLKQLEGSLEHGLLKYASIFWHRHLQNAGPSPEIFEEIRNFMKSPNIWTCIQVQGKFAPHMFAKLSYNAKADYYRMLVPGRDNKMSSSNEEFYADALPQWLVGYDNQEDHLIWGYHMLVREWGEILVRYPDTTQRYFPKILGARSFWNIDNGFDDGTGVTTVEEVTNARNPSSVRNSDSFKTSPTAPNDSDFSATVDDDDYIKKILRELKGEWKLNHITESRNESSTANLCRYKLCNAPEVEEEEEEDSDTESSDDDTPPSLGPQEHSLWFLSVKNNQGDSRWYHHEQKLGVLQRSTVVFISHTPWLLWPQDESSMLMVDLKTWETVVTNLPHVSKRTEHSLVTQDYYHSSITKELYRASIYRSNDNVFTIKHRIFSLSPSNTPSDPPRITSSKHPTQETTWRPSSGSLYLPSNFFWHKSTLLVALGSTSAKLLRFSVSPPALSPDNQPYKPTPISILMRPLFIPSSSYTRNLRFTISSNSGFEHAIFNLDSAPQFGLPAVTIDFRLGEDEWKDYDPDVDGDGGLGMGDTRGFLKGAYAAKEQAFSVPIRSGLDWRRSVYVTCW